MLTVSFTRARSFAPLNFLFLFADMLRLAWRKNLEMHLSCVMHKENHAYL
jgi:hypothetical protein